ncbi:MAG: fatty acid desaturase [Rhodobacteraceae bacterium]|nr:fatty acid desaturase [Paracoccaceae bacterium]
MLRQRDYSLLGKDGERAVEMGLAAADWYLSEVPRSELKSLMRRSDRIAIRDTLLWLGGLILFAGIGIALWPSIWSAPFWLAYGVLYGSAGDSRWHEAGHGTAFSTQWMNEVVYQLGSFMMMRNPTAWRWSHIRHHTDTIIVGRDPEIAVMRPPDAIRICLNLLAIPNAVQSFTRMGYHVTGRLHPEEATYVPEQEWNKVILESRIWCVIYALTIAATLWWSTLLPLMVIGLPSIYGAWHHILTGVLQHAALAEDVLDHRLNTRTFYTNPITRFVYWNMNYHVEHHMFPMVPYHALPRLHALIRDDLPEPDKSMWHAYRQVLPVLIRQLRGEDVFLVRELPDSAQPYRAELHNMI